MLTCLLLASAAAVPAIRQDIYADASPLLAATRGLVREATPVLGYDMEALAAYAAQPEQPIRLSYAGFDKSEWRELEIAHQTAADIVRDGNPADARR